MGETPEKKILIVEDDPDVAEATEIVLAGAGYGVQRAANATEGLAQVRQDRPDLVLLDVMMPAGTEGFHFVWELRKEAEEAVRSTPIVIMTALHRKTRVRFYPEQSDGVYGPYEYLPVQGFLDKPVASEELLGTVARVLSEAPATGGEGRGGAQ